MKSLHTSFHLPYQWLSERLVVGNIKHRKFSVLIHKYWPTPYSGIRSLAARRDCLSLLTPCRSTPAVATLDATGEDRLELDVSSL